MVRVKKFSTATHLKWIDTRDETFKLINWSTYMQPLYINSVRPDVILTQPPFSSKIKCQLLTVVFNQRFESVTETISFLFSLTTFLSKFPPNRMSAKMVQFLWVTHLHSDSRMMSVPPGGEDSCPGYALHGEPWMLVQNAGARLLGSGSLERLRGV